MSRAGMIRVLIVDDHALIRIGIRRLLFDAQGVEVVGEASNGEDAIKYIREHPVDVVLLDVKMPGIGGLETTRRLHRIEPDAKIIAVTAFYSEPFPTRILQAGAAGYLTKECDVDEMLLAIKKVHLGQRYISPEIAQSMAINSISELGTESSSLEILSERELQVMIMITSGLSVKDISDKLCLSSKTVNSYRYRLFEKLKIKNDVELTHIAIRHNLLEKASFGKLEEEPEQS
jgi:two-component system, NarL family, invasion response regulator UvrY